MSAKNNFYEAIDDFLFGRLGKEKENNFRQALETDEELAKALANRKHLHDGMKEGGRRKLKTELDAIYTEIYEPEKQAKVKSLIPWRRILMVASLVLFGLLSWWLWTPREQFIHPAFAEYYQPFNLILATRGGAEEVQIKQAAQLYRAQKYKASVPLLENALNNLENKDAAAQLQLALAIARFESGDTANAFQPLNDIIESNDLFLSDQARWYTALFHLQLNQTPQALPYLQMLADKPGADKHVEAQKILTELK